MNFDPKVNGTTTDQIHLLMNSSSPISCGTASASRVEAKICRFSAQTFKPPFPVRIRNLTVNLLLNCTMITALPRKIDMAQLLLASVANWRTTEASLIGEKRGS